MKYSTKTFLKAKGNLYFKEIIGSLKKMNLGKIQCKFKNIKILPNSQFEKTFVTVFESRVPLKRNN